MFVTFPKNIDRSSQGIWVRLESLRDGRCNLEYVRFPHPAEINVYVADYCRRTATALCYGPFNAWDSSNPYDEKLIGTTEH